MDVHELITTAAPELVAKCDDYTRGFTDSEKMEFGLIVNFMVESFAPNTPTPYGLSLILHKAHAKMMEIKNRRKAMSDGYGTTA